jgi:hypothetical protein
VICHVIRLLSTAEAEYYAKEIKYKKRYWIPRGGFYTIGASTYLDDPAAYPALSWYTNPVNWRLLGRLQDDLIAALPDGYCPNRGETVTGTAMIGAHIFTPETNGVQGNPHIDEPYERIDWGQKYSNPFSFTLALEMPKAGGGMDYWPDATDADIEWYNERGELPPHEHLRYEAGFLYVHDGLTPHRIANCGDMEEGEHRITLQGHGVTLEDGTTAIYF